MKNKPQWYLAGSASVLVSVVIFHSFLAARFASDSWVTFLSLLLVVAAAMILGAVLFLRQSSISSSDFASYLDAQDAGNIDFTDLILKPGSVITGLARNVGNLRERCLGLERISHLLNFINYSVELKRQLKVALSLGNEIFPDYSLLVFLANNNELGFAVGSRPIEGGCHSIEPGEPLVREAGEAIRDQVFVERLVQVEWKSFVLPLRHDSTRASEFMIMPLMVWNRIRGVIVYKPLSERRLDSGDSVLATMLNRHVAIFIENHNLFGEKLRQDRIENELRIAREVQTGSLPSRLIAFPGFDMYAVCCPCNEISGDYYDFIRVSDRLMVLAVADVSGKGLPSALFLSKIQTLVRAMVDQFDSPAAFLGFLSRKMSEENMGSLFATMNITYVRANNPQMLSSSAGHCRPLVIRQRSGYVEEVNFETGIPLGLFDHNVCQYVDQKIELMPGDGLFLYSDGVTDVVNSKNERFGVERLKNVLDDAPSGRAENAVEFLLQKLNHFRGKVAQDDDITALYIKSEPESQ